MSIIRCPSCGAPYNGKKCRVCLYEPMETGIPSGTGKKTVQRPAVPRQTRQKSIGSSLLGLFFILAMICIMMPVFRNWGMKLDAIEAINRTPEPIPGNPTVLFQHESIAVLVPENDSPSISLWFYNHGREDAVVVCKDVTVNGYRMEKITLSVYVPAGSAVKGTLLELETLADSFAFAIEAQKPNGEFLFETAPIRLDRE